MIFDGDGWDTAFGGLGYDIISLDTEVADLGKQ